MKTVSILQYDQEFHQFCPSFGIQDDFEDADHECAFDELVLHPSPEWMDDYLEWNRFGRLPDDPAEDMSEELSIPTFQSLEELHQFNAQGHDLTRRLQKQLEQSRGTTTCAVQVAPFRPLYTNVVVGPVAAWWHVKDLNYGFVVPVQRLSVSDQLKSRLQAFRCHKGMEFWKFNDSKTMEQLQEEGRQLQVDLQRELSQENNIPAAAAEGESRDHQKKTLSLATMVEQSCCIEAITPVVEKGNRLPPSHSRSQ